MVKKKKPKTANTDIPKKAPVASSVAPEFFIRIREILARSRGQALQAVNATMVRAYWEIGREIVQEEQRGAARAGYGEQLLNELDALPPALQRRKAACTRVLRN